MKKLSEIALNECIVELRAACRLRIDEEALATMMSWVRPQFVEILDNADGRKRWSDHGQLLRDNGRFLGTFANFFARHTEASTVGLEEITRAFEMLRADCTVRSERTPVAWTYCPPAARHSEAEELLRAIAPTLEFV